MSEQTVASVLRSSLSPAQFQLNIVADKAIDNVSKTAANAAILMVNQIETIVLEQYNKEVDEFNNLCDELENVQLSHELLKKDHENLVASVAEIRLDAKQAKSEAERDKATALLIKTDMKDKLNELKHLQQMQPEKLKKRVGELRKSNDEKQKLLEQQRKKINELKNSLLDVDTKKSVQVQANLKMSEELVELRKRLSYKDGDVSKKNFNNPGSKLHCFGKAANQLK